MPLPSSAGVDDVLGHEDFQRPGIVGGPGGKIHDGPEVISVPPDHRADVDADPSRRQILLVQARDELDGGADGPGRVAEVHHDAVSEQLDEPAVGVRGDLLDGLDEARRVLHGLLVARFLRQPRVPADVHEGDRGRGSSERNPLARKRRLHELDDVLEDSLIGDAVEEQDDEPPAELAVAPRRRTTSSRKSRCTSTTCRMLSAVARTTRTSRSSAALRLRFP